MDRSASEGPRSNEKWSPVPVQSRDLEAAIRAAVNRSNAFASVVTITARNEPARLPGPATATAAGASAEARELASAAWSERADLLLRARVRRNAVRYVDHNGRWPLNVVNFLIVGWTAWFVADERYAAELDVEVSLTSAGNEKCFMDRTYHVSRAYDLDHFDRGLSGWTLIGVLSVPTALEPENYAKAGEVVMPYARNALACDIALDLAGFAARGPSVEEGLAKAVGVSIGVGRRRAGRAQGIRELRAATDDATAFRKLLVDPSRGGIPERNVTLLAEDGGTKARILEVTRAAASRATRPDTLYLYFSGYGFESSGELYLAPSDLYPSDPCASAISLAELDGALAPSGGRVVVILETSFGGGELPQALSRTLSPALLPGLKTAAAEGSADRIRRALERFARRRVVIVASEPGTAVADLALLTDDKGNLTARLLDAAASPLSDADHDGRLSVAELLDAARQGALYLSRESPLVTVPELFSGPGIDPRAIFVTRAP